MEILKSKANQAEIPHRLPAWVSWAAFSLGLTGSISLRLILIAKAYHPALIDFFWYLGVCGNMVFFMFRAYISFRRRRVIEERRLLTKLQEPQSLSEEDLKALHYLVSSLKISKERWNYWVIFLCSFLAIAWDLWLRFSK